MERTTDGLPINDAVPAPTRINAGNEFLWNWRAMQEYALRCVEDSKANETPELPYDSTAGEIVDHFLHIGRTMKPVGHWPGERVYTAIERLLNTPRDFISPQDRSPERPPTGRGR